ncbi:MAG: sulfatase [Phycisphaerales bacterium]|jgi:N-sulfoglucosamine sulfohydrolase|nr:sulfatase [Phycisphaerales bacterium]
MQTRRTFMKTTVGTTLAATAMPSILSAAPKTKQPNIVWLFIEDQHPWWSCYPEVLGGNLVKTPALDALAQDGVRFERCYVPTPVCSPCRSAIVTGTYSIRTGIHDHRSSRHPGAQIHLPEGVCTAPELFRKAGYNAFNKGKDDYNFNYDRKAVYTLGTKPGTVSFYGGKGGGSIAEANAKSKPFFGQIQAHGGKSGNRVKARFVGGVKATDPKTVTVPPQYPDIPQIRNEIAHHHDTMLCSDYDAANVVKQIKAAGQWDNTILFVFTDHGGKMARAKQFCYDEGLHVPLIIAGGALPKELRGTTRKDLINLLDITATSMAFAGIDIPEWMDSKDLFAKGYGRKYIFSNRDRCDFTIERIRSVMGERFHYIRNFLTDRVLYQHNYRSKGEPFKTLKKMHEEGKLTPAQAAGWEKRAPEELYDLQADPNEIKNLATDPKYKKVLDEYRAALEGWLKDTDDKAADGESKEGLRATMTRWGKNCINPEFKGLTPLPMPKKEKIINKKPKKNKKVKK